MRQARYIMVGGFLGAGKTTAILRLAERLSGQGLRVGLITNDQSHGLVDTTLLAARGFPVEEIGGGCFCCRFESLVEAAARLTDEAKPDVFVAEPVGSCTDLVAAVNYPLRLIYGDRFAVAPLTVVVDPIRALRVLGVEPGRSFSRKVHYVYEKQLEEADIVLINKRDLLTGARAAALRNALAAHCPKATLLEVSARHGDNLEAWFGRVTTGDAVAGHVLDIDYDEYADGEARLGWLNCSVRVAGVPFDGNRLLQNIALRLRRLLEEAGARIAHVKMTLVPDDEAGDIGVLNLARDDQDGELSFALQAALEAGRLLVNARAEADPDLLRAAVVAALDAQTGDGVDLRLEHIEHFRPGRPAPTHRLAQI